MSMEKLEKLIKKEIDLSKIDIFENLFLQSGIKKETPLTYLAKKYEGKNIERVFFNLQKYIGLKNSDGLTASNILKQNMKLSFNMCCILDTEVAELSQNKFVIYDLEHPEDNEDIISFMKILSVISDVGKKIKHPIEGIVHSYMFDKYDYIKEKYGYGLLSKYFNFFENYITPSDYRFNKSIGELLMTNNKLNEEDINFFQKFRKIKNILNETFKNMKKIEDKKTILTNIITNIVSETGKGKITFSGSGKSICVKI